MREDGHWPAALCFAARPSYPLSDMCDVKNSLACCGQIVLQVARGQIMGQAAFVRCWDLKRRLAAATREFCIPLKAELSFSSRHQRNADPAPGPPNSRPRHGFGSAKSSSEHHRPVAVTRTHRPAHSARMPWGAGSDAREVRPPARHPGSAWCGLRGSCGAPSENNQQVSVILLGCRAETCGLCGHLLECAAGYSCAQRRTIAAIRSASSSMLLTNLNCVRQRRRLWSGACVLK